MAEAAHETGPQLRPGVRRYVQYINAAAVTGGYDDCLYRPRYVVTRNQMAVYVSRAFGLVTSSAGSELPTGELHGGRLHHALESSR